MSEAGLLPVRSAPAPRKAFVVHGHDEGAREAVARFLERIGFEAIILHEQASQGRTVIEKIEAHGDALIGVMVYSFARIGAALGMTVEDVFTQNRRLWVRLREKGGKRHAMPCHHNLEEYLTAYIDGADLRGDPKGPLFRTIGRGTSQLTRTVLPQANAYAMIGRRAAAAGIATKLGNHSFRATGITAYLKNGGTLEKAAAMANHASTRTTQLYDRRRDEVSLDEVERIAI
jgi:integrase